MYKPNFCAECGERITRARWRVWTSRRFCAGCARRLRRSQILAPVLTGIALFGCGLMTGRRTRQAPAPLIIERGANSPPASAARDDAAAASPVKESLSQPASGYGPDGTVMERPTDQHETVSICGARTKKGTPCSRRVRGTGRCWQHRGMTAIIPVEKLIVTESRN